MAEGQAFVHHGQPRIRGRVARLVTEVLAPAPVAAGLLVVVAFHSTTSPAAALGWALLSTLFASVFPLLYVVVGVRRRRLTDHHVGLREQRPRILIVGIGLVAAGLALLAWLGAPREIMALLGAMIVGLVIALVITLVWKLSIHTATASGAVVILALVLGPAWLSLFVLVGLIAWARVELRDHSPAQVLVGALVGAAVAGTCFTLLR